MGLIERIFCTALIVLLASLVACFNTTPKSRAEFIAAVAAEVSFGTAIVCALIMVWSRS